MPVEVLQWGFKAFRPVGVEGTMASKTQQNTQILDHGSSKRPLQLAVLCFALCMELHHPAKGQHPRTLTFAFLQQPHCQHTALCVKAHAEGRMPLLLACRLSLTFWSFVVRGGEEPRPDAAPLDIAPEDESCRACCSTCARATSAKRDGFLRNSSVWQEQGKTAYNTQPANKRVRGGESK